MRRLRAARARRGATAAAVLSRVAVGLAALLLAGAALVQSPGAAATEPAPAVEAETPSAGPRVDLSPADRDALAASLRLLGEDQPDSALARLERASRQGDPDALFAIGVLLETGHRGTPRNPELALRAYQRAAELGQPKAQVIVAEHILAGSFGPVDPQIARALLVAAARRGEARARALLAERGWTRGELAAETRLGRLRPAEARRPDRSAMSGAASKLRQGESPQAGERPLEAPLVQVAVRRPAAAPEPTAPPSAAPQSAAPQSAEPQSANLEPGGPEPAGSAAAAASSPAWRAWVGSMKTERGARRLVDELQAGFGTLAARMDLQIHRRRPEGQTAYRLYSEAQPSRAAAARLCAQIKQAAAGQDCLVIRD